MLDVPESRLIIYINNKCWWNTLLQKSIDLQERECRSISAMGGDNFMIEIASNLIDLYRKIKDKFCRKLSQTHSPRRCTALVKLSFTHKIGTESKLKKWKVPNEVWP